MFGPVKDWSSKLPTRRFPTPWTVTVEERLECFIVRDASGQSLGYFPFTDEPVQRASTKRLSRDEARRIATKFASLPDLLRRDAMARAVKEIFD